MCWGEVAVGAVALAVDFAFAGAPVHKGGPPRAAPIRTAPPATAGGSVRFALIGFREDGGILDLGISS